MKKQLFVFFTIALSAFLLSCGTVRYAAPFQIGLSPLEEYRPTSASMQEDTAFMVFKNEQAFNTSFSSTSASARQPGFNGQMVVTIVFKNAAVTPLRFEKAEVSGNTINVYTVSCEAGCKSGQALLATIPKVGNASGLQYFVNGEKKKYVAL